MKLPHNNRFKTLLNGIDFFSYKTKIILWVKNYVQQKKKNPIKIYPLNINNDAREIGCGELLSRCLSLLKSVS